MICWAVEQWRTAERAKDSHREPPQSNHRAPQQGSRQASVNHFRATPEQRQAGERSNGRRRTATERQGRQGTTVRDIPYYIYM